MKFRKPSRATGTLIVVLTAFIAATMFAQKLADARADDETTAKLVSAMIARYHISQKKIDEEVSEQTFDQFIGQLDGRKQYFMKSDVDRLNASREKLGDQIKEGDVSFAYQAFEVYKKRVLDRSELAKQFIDAPHDFTLDESIVIESDSIEWAKTDAEMKDRWRKRVKNDILSLKLDDEPMDKIKDRLQRRYDGIARAVRQMEKHEILEMYLSALANAFDPHSSYMSPQTVEDFNIIMQHRLQGIGATLRSEDGYTIVADVVEGGAAHSDGRLKKGDKITAVDQHADGEWVDVVEMKLSKVVRYIRGKAGTKLRLKVKKADKVDKKAGKTTPGGVEIYDLTRQVIQLKSMDVSGKILKSSDRVQGSGYRVGVVYIPSFYRDFEGASLGVKDFKSTSRDVRKVLDGFKAAGGVDLVVVDLRSNPGGSLTEAIEVSGLFIDKGPVVQVKTLDSPPRSYDDLDDGTAYDGPLAVICDKGAASASEIFAGVIKDYQRGVIIGDRSTHGKGTVQNVMPVGKNMLRFVKATDRGKLKLTIQQFYRVNGDSTQVRGVPSDVVLPSLRDFTHEGEGSIDNALKFNRVEPADFKPLGMTSSKLIEELQQSSKSRVEKNGEFDQTKKEIALYLKLKNRKELSLNEEIRRKEQAEAKALEQATEENEDEPEEKEEVFPKSPYNDEVLRIGADYLQLLKELKTAGK